MMGNGTELNTGFQRPIGCGEAHGSVVSDINHLVIGLKDEVTMRVLRDGEQWIAISKISTRMNVLMGSLLLAMLANVYVTWAKPVAVTQHMSKDELQAIAHVMADELQGVKDQNVKDIARIVAEAMRVESEKADE